MTAGVFFFSEEGAIAKMIHEVARITIDAAKADEFEAAVVGCAHLFRQAEGCHHMVMHRIIEEPGAYYLMVVWESVAHHLDIFRPSPAFQEWRDRVGIFYVAPPQVVHTVMAADFF